MATENKILDVSHSAGEDLSDDQFRFVVLDTDGTVRRPNSADEDLYGILQNAPESGQAAAVRIIGISKLEANGALAVGKFVSAEYVSATDAGKGKDAAGNMQRARALVLEATAAENDLASVLLIGPQANSKVVFSVPLPALTANDTIYAGCFAAGRAMKINRISIAAQAKPSDADGVMTLALSNYDASATTDDNLLAAATFDLEGLTAKTAEDLSLTAVPADLVLAAEDFVYATLVNDSAGIDTNLLGGVLTFEAELL